MRLAHPRLVSRKLSLLTFALIACSGEPPTAVAPISPDALDGGVSATPSRVDACVRPAEPLPAVGFARHASGDLVAFEPATGRELARHPFGSEILDLDWDARTRRLLVTTTEAFDVEGSRVHALSLDVAQFTHEASSEVFPGEVRAVATPTRVLVVGVELGSTWYELDDELSVVGKSGDLPQPVLLAEPDAVSLLALRREDHADLVYRVSGFGAGWTSVELALPRPSPERGVVIAVAGAHAWLLKRGSSPEAFEVADLETAGLPSSSPPSFRPVPGRCGLGAPHSLVAGASGCALVTVTGPALDRLAVIPTTHAGTMRCATLGAPLARADVWVPRNLRVDPGGRRAWVATAGGVESFALDLSAEKLSSFDGAELRAPLALAR